MKIAYNMEQVFALLPNDFLKTIETRLKDDAIDRWKTETGRKWPQAPYLRPDVDYYAEGEDTVVVEVLE